MDWLCLETSHNIRRKALSFLKTEIRCVTVGVLGDVTLTRTIGKSGSFMHNSARRVFKIKPSMVEMVKSDVF